MWTQSSHLQWEGFQPGHPQLLLNMYFGNIFVLLFLSQLVKGKEIQSVIVSHHSRAVLTVILCKCQGLAMHMYPPCALCCAVHHTSLSLKKNCHKNDSSVCLSENK